MEFLALFDELERYSCVSCRDGPEVTSLQPRPSHQGGKPSQSFVVEDIERAKGVPLRARVAKTRLPDTCKAWQAYKASNSGMISVGRTTV